MATKTALHKFKTQELMHMSLGQAGCAYINDTSTYTPTAGNVVVAIQVIDEATFDNGMVAESTAFPDNDTAEAGGGNAFGGDLIPPGLIIYGRWTAIQLSGGAVMVYIG